MLPLVVVLSIVAPAVALMCLSLRWDLPHARTARRWQAPTYRPVPAPSCCWSPVPGATLVPERCGRTGVQPGPLAPWA